jgi:long-chain acyl-CoA synthetase
MLDLSRHACLGAALREALERWPHEVCLIEADRERENCRLTYAQFKQAALPLAAALEERGAGAGTRVAIIMTNQSKWLISAYAVFHAGGVLVPLDYKLTPAEHLALLAHSGAEFLIVEHHLWRAIMQVPGTECRVPSGAPANLGTRDWALGAPLGTRCSALGTVLVTGAPPNADLAGAFRWEEFRCQREPRFVPRQRQDAACIVYSSGTAGRPKGCVLTHENYLEQCIALTSLYPFWPGVRYLSVLPTNHAIDFMVGFIGPFTCGAAVVHLRTLRPEYVREAFARFKITYVSLVPMVLKNLRQGLEARFAALPWPKRQALNILVAVNRALTRRRPHLKLSRLLLKEVHAAFGGELRAIFAGGAFSEPALLDFFYGLGILVANGYGLTEAGTAVSVNDFQPFRADTVGKPLPGIEVRIVDPDPDGIGEVAVRGKTVMSHYLDDPDLNAQTMVDGWLMTGDLGRLGPDGHLRLFGRKKNMIVTEGGKNVYPEDVEAVFEDLAVKELCVFAANFIWPERTMTGEKLVIVLRLEQGQVLDEALLSELRARNRRLPDYQRVSGCLVWNRDFPRTASLKIKREALAEQLRAATSRSAMIEL